MAAPSRFYCRSGFRRQRTQDSKIFSENIIHRSTSIVSIERIYLENGWVPWQELIPDNVSGYPITESLHPCRKWIDLSNFEKACTIQEAIQPDGVIMLLPGQQIKGRPWSSRSHPIHLNQNRADKIVRLAALEETEEYAEMEKCVDELLLHGFPKFYLTPSQPNAPDASTSYHFRKPYYSLAILGLFYAGILAIPLARISPPPQKNLSGVFACAS